MVVCFIFGLPFVRHCIIAHARTFDKRLNTKLLVQRWFLQQFLFYFQLHDHMTGEHDGPFPLRNIYSMPPVRFTSIGCSNADCCYIKYTYHKYALCVFCIHVCLSVCVCVPTNELQNYEPLKKNDDEKKPSAQLFDM